MGNCACTHKVKDLGLDRLVDECLQERHATLDVVSDLRVDLVVKSGEAAKDSWSQALNIFNQVLQVTRIIAYSEAVDQGVEVHDLLLDMCQWCIR